MYRFKYKIETLTKTESFEISINACNSTDARNFLQARYPLNEYAYELISCENNNK
jgi:hypothetical protein